jgi:hypothetical protein
MTIGIVLSVGHHAKGNAARRPTAKFSDGGRLLFDQDLFGGRRGLLLF